MGLDITVVEKLGEFIGKDEEDLEAKGYHYDDAVFIYPNSDYELQSDGLDKIGYYSIEGETHGFRAGSYGGYNYFRNTLALSAHGVKSESIWNDHSKYKGKLFFEIINFSDCEGVIGPSICQKLALDFVGHQDNYKYYVAKHESRDEWVLETYNRFLTAFNVAAGTGVLCFH